jgi:ligand-binding sensor domain-containing protein
MNATHGIPTKALLAALASVTLIAGAAAAATQKIKVIKLTGDASPGSVASAYGSIWVASHSGLGVYRFDPRTNRLLKWIRVGENQCVDLTAGAGAMWVWNCSGETGSGLVYEISARTDRVVRRLNGMYGTFGDGSLWTQSEDWTKVLRVDPRSGLTVARIPLPIPVPATGHVFPAAVCYGSLWSVADTTVIRYDTATNKVAAVIPLLGRSVRPPATAVGSTPTTQLARRTRSSSRISPVFTASTQARIRPRNFRFL